MYQHRYGVNRSKLSSMGGDSGANLPTHRGIYSGPSTPQGEMTRPRLSVEICSEPWPNLVGSRRSRCRMKDMWRLDETDVKLSVTAPGPSVQSQRHHD